MLNLSTVLSNLNLVESLNPDALRPLDEPISIAIFHFFGGGTESEEMLSAFSAMKLSEWHSVAALQTEVREAVRIVLLQIEVAQQEFDGTESTIEFDELEHLQLGEFFIGLLWEREFEKQAPYAFTLTSGRPIGDVELICALMMIQVGQVASYLQTQNSVAACTLMWDLHRLDVELERILRDRESSEEARERSRDLNQIRHRKALEAKEAVWAAWASNPSLHPSAEKAGLYYSEWLEKKGIRYEPRTVTRWIREHAKATGVKFR